MDNTVTIQRDIFTRLLKQSILFLLLLATFRTLIKFPFKEAYFQLEFVYEVLLLIFLVVYFMDKIFSKKSFHSFELFLLLILLAPIYSGILAQARFNQPIMYGVLAQRSYLLVINGLLLFYMLKTGFVQFVDVKKIFLFLAWFCLISYLLLVVALPQDYMDNSIKSYNESKGGDVYRFDTSFLVIGFFFYFISGIRNNKQSYLLLALIFIAYLIFFHKGRGLLLSIVGTLLIYFTIHVSLIKKVKYTIYALIVVALGFITLRTFFPELLEGYYTSYGNLVNVIFGKSTGEASADSRIYQLALVKGYWDEDWSKIIFGSGTLSNQWNGGFKKLFGYFYYVDIGWYGIVFVFGLIGFLVFKLQYVLYIKYFREIKKSDLPENDFITALKYYLLFIFIKSMMNGEDTFEIQKGLLVMAIFAFVLTSLKSNRQLS